MIANLGGESLKALCAPTAFYVDLAALTDEDKGRIVRWAAEKNLVETKTMWCSWSYDEEREGWSASLMKDETSALDEALCHADIDGPSVTGRSYADAVEELEARYATTPPGGSFVYSEAVCVLTGRGNVRAKGFGRDIDATEMAVMFWAEDVLRKSMPSVIGVWWREEFDPDNLSAPRGAVFPSCLKRLDICEVSSIDDDEELLAAMPETRLISPMDTCSPYEFVTNCISSTDELISPMKNSYAVTDLEFKEFARELGGIVREGRELLNEVFPDYQASGMDIKKDWHVRYHASQFDGLPCVFVVHSAVEYVFQRSGLINAPVVSNPDADSKEDDVSDCPNALPCL